MNSIIPRLDYNFTFKDLLVGIKAVFNAHIDDTMLKEYCGNNHIYYFNKSRTALYIALKALNMPLGTKVGVMVYNCHTVFNAITAAGYIPVFIDITNDFKIDLIDLKNKAKFIKVIVLTHLFGIVNDVTKIKLDYPDIIIIEDCAHAFNSPKAGKHGVMSTFSMGKAKFPSVADGGYLVVNNTQYLPILDGIYEKIKNPSIINEFISIFNNIFLCILHKKLVYGLFTYPFLKNIYKTLSVNVRLSEKTIMKSSKAIYLERIKHIQCYQLKQTENGKMISLVAGFKPIEDTNYFMYPILVKNPVSICSMAINVGVEFGRHFSQSILLAKSFGYNGECKNAEKLQEHILVIPTYCSIKSNDFIKILNAVRSLLSNENLL